ALQNVTVGDVISAMGSEAHSHEALSRQTHLAILINGRWQPEEQPVDWCDSMLEDTCEDLESRDHSIRDSEQADFEDGFDDWDWVDSEMQREAEEDARERVQWSKEMEIQNEYRQRLANMTVKYLNMQGSEIHTSKPYPLCHVEPCESFREAWLHTLHEGNSPDRRLSLRQLRLRRQEIKKPIPAETLQYRSAREVLLHDLDSGPAGPIPLDTTKLVLGGGVITDTWSWRELLGHSLSNDVVHVQVVYISEKATGAKSEDSGFVAMAPCHRCGFGTRSGRGQGWCSNPQCRQAEKEECLAQKSAEKIVWQQQRAAQGAGSRGPLREENSRKAERRQLHEERARAKAEEEAGGRGPLREEDSKEAERRQLREARARAKAEEEAGGRGPLREEDSREAERRQLHEARARAKAEEEAGGRGPLREEDGKREERRQLREARARAKAEEEAGGRGPLRGEDGKEGERRQLREARERAKAEEEAGGRGPLREEDGKREERRQLREARARAKSEEEAGGRGPLREEDSKEEERRQLREARERAKAEEGVGGRGPRP
ncbi:pfh1, partial [Symbiodinium natans]